MNLTERELDVLAYVLIGEMSYQDVAEVLNINKSTVNTYMRRVMNKTQCADISNLKQYIEIDDLEDRYKGLTGGVGLSLNHKTLLTASVIVALNILVTLVAIKILNGV